MGNFVRDLTWILMTPYLNLIPKFQSFLRSPCHHGHTPHPQIQVSSNDKQDEPDGDYSSSGRGFRWKGGWEQVRSGDASAAELFEHGVVMLRRKIYPAATYLVQAIEKWDRDDQDIPQLFTMPLGVSYVCDRKLGDAYEQKKDFKSALNAFEEVLLFYPNNKVAQPRRDALKEQVKLYIDVLVKTKER